MTKTIYCENHGRNTFIIYSDAMSHMVNSEENMMNLKNAKTRVIIEDSKTLTMEKIGDWHVY